MEDVVGGFPAYNDDDDDRNLTRDYYDTIGPYEDEDDLLALALYLVDTSSGSAKLTVTGASKIRLWEDPDKEVELELDLDGAFTWDFSNGDIMPETLWIEGINLSDAPRDVTIHLGGQSCCGDTVSLSVVKVDLDIDSDNTNGFNAPDRSDAEDWIEGLTTDPYNGNAPLPGKYIAINDGDLDGDALVDFADDQIAGGQFVPMRLEISAGIDLDVATVWFLYPSSDPADVNCDGGNPPLCTAPLNYLRVWLQDANGSRSQDSANESTPGDFIDNYYYLNFAGQTPYYTPAQLGLSNGNRTVTLYLEAVNLPPSGASSQFVQVRVSPDGQTEFLPVFPASTSDAVRMTPVKLDLTIDSDNNGKVDNVDELVEDNSAFMFWVNDDDNASADYSNHRVYAPSDEPELPQTAWDSSNSTIQGVWDLIDFVAIRIHVSAGVRQAIHNAGCSIHLHFDLGDEGLIRFFASTDTLVENGQLGQDSFLLSSQRAQEQLNLAGSNPLPNDGGMTGDLPLPESYFDVDDEIWLIFEATDTTYRIDLPIHLVVKDGNGNLILRGDRVYMDARYSKNMFRTYSARGTQFNYTYRTERLADTDPLREAPGGVEQFPIPVYGNPTFGDFSQDSDDLLFFIHGYNVPYDAANKSFQAVYKRLYRVGYRGNMVGYTWRGDQDTNPLPWFDINVENAFYSSLGLKSLIIAAKNDDKALNVMAHSLGNLVIVDALRRLAIEPPGTPPPNNEYLENLVHVEAAVWETIYDPRPLDITDREVEQRAEWTHWSTDISNLIAGDIINCYNTADFALNAMRSNDLVFHAAWSGPSPLSPTYESWALDMIDFRYPYRLGFIISGNPNRQTDAFAPLGQVPFAQSQPNMIPRNSSAFGWDPDAHSNFLNKPFQEVKDWYFMVLPYVEQ